MKAKHKKKILLIDSNHAAHRSYNTMRNLSFAGKPTGLIFGYFNILISNIAIHKPDKIVACWDPLGGGKNPERLKLHPDYKKRPRKIDFDYKSFARQCVACRKMVRALGIPQVIKDETEADDNIYALQKKYTKKGYKVIILSGDKDFNPLVSDQVFIANPNKNVLIHPKNFKKVIGVDTPDQYLDYLALDGDVSDNVPGVKGYGEKTILKFLKEHGSIGNFIAKGPQGKDYDKIFEATGLSKSLIDLEWFNKRFKIKIDDSFFYKQEKKPEKNLKRYKKLCQKYGLKKWANDDYLKHFL